MIVYHVDEQARTVRARFDVYLDHAFGQLRELDENFASAAVDGWAVDLKRHLRRSINSTLGELRASTELRRTMERIIGEVVAEVLSGRTLPGAFIGTARCTNSDEFDVEQGKALARERLLRKFGAAKRKADTTLRMRLGGYACTLQQLTQRLHERRR